MPQKAYLHVDFVQPEELVFNRARMRRAFVKIGQVQYYQFDFTVKYEITETDTRQQDDLDGLPDLKTLSINVDFIEPGTGPDGDIEHHTEITFQE